MKTRKHTYILWKTIFSIVIILSTNAILMACHNKNMEDEGPQKNVLISLQPFDNFTQKEAESLQKDLEKNLSPLIGDIGVQIEILPNKPLSDDLKNDTKNRYRADKIINSLEKNANKKNIIIGLYNLQPSGLPLPLKLELGNIHPDFRTFNVPAGGVSIKQWQGG